MGLGIGFGGSSYSSYDNRNCRCGSSGSATIEKVAEKPVKLPNPDPYNWIINDSWQRGQYLLIDITYPDCKNYEGKKVMVYEDVTLDELRKQKTIDPHFSSNKKFYSPIARFEPTKRGWEMGMMFIELLWKEEK